MAFPFEWPVIQGDSWPAFEEFPDIDNFILNNNNGCNCDDITINEEPLATSVPIINNQSSSHDDSDEQRTTTTCSGVRDLPSLMTEVVHDVDKANTMCMDQPQTLVQQEEDTRSIRVSVDDQKSIDDFDDQELVFSFDGVDENSFDDRDWENFFSYDDSDDHFVDKTTTLTTVAAEVEADHISHSHHQQPPHAESSLIVTNNNNNNNEILMKNNNNMMMMTRQEDEKKMMMMMQHQALVMQPQQQEKSIVYYDDKYCSSSTLWLGGASNNNNSVVYKRKSQSNSYWTEAEHMRFLEALLNGYRSDWQTTAKLYVPTKSIPQITSHAQKYFKHHQNLSNTNKRRKTIHDVCLPGFDHSTIINTSLLSFRPQ